MDILDNKEYFPGPGTSSSVIQLGDELSSSDYWQQQVTLALVARLAGGTSHFYAKAYAKALKAGNTSTSKKPVLTGLVIELSNGLTLVDATTELVLALLEKHKGSQDHMTTFESNRLRVGDDAHLVVLNDEELLKQQDIYHRRRRLPPLTQRWASLDMSLQGIFNLSPNLCNRYQFLTKLYLNNNHLSVIPKSIKNLRFLRVLDLSNNELALLPVEMNQLFNLRYLFLFDNKLSTIPREFGNLYELLFLGIEGNPFDTELSLVIAKHGTKGLIHSLRDLVPRFSEPPQLRQWVGLNEEGEPEEMPRVPDNTDKNVFTVLTYNTLCQHYATSKLYGYTPSWALDWEYRKKLLLKEVELFDGDIVCLQEVETQLFDDMWFGFMKEHGYRGIFHNKGRARLRGNDLKKVDGCALLYKLDKFSLLDKVFIEFSSVLLSNERYKKTEDVFNRFIYKDNIAVVTFLEHTETKKKVLVVNTHLHWDPAYNDVKTLQVAVMLEELQTLTKKYAKNGHKDISIVICGDFNSQTHSAVYQLLSSGKCVSHDDLKGVDYGKYTDEGFLHPFQFKSAYSTIGEMPFTNFTPTFTEVIDYIWYSTQTLEIKGMLGKIKDEYITNLIGFPDQVHPSDHIPLFSEFRFKDSKKNRSRKI